MSDKEKAARLRKCYSLLVRLAHEKTAASRESLDGDTRRAATVEAAKQQNHLTEV
jgi:hypothetical protein